MRRSYTSVASGEVQCHTLSIEKGLLSFFFLIILTFTIFWICFRAGGIRQKSFITKQYKLGNLRAHTSDHTDVRTFETLVRNLHCLVFYLRLRDVTGTVRIVRESGTETNKRRHKSTSPGKVYRADVDTRSLNVFVLSCASLL